MSTTELVETKHTDESSKTDGDVSGRWIRDQLRDVASGSEASAGQNVSVLEQATAEALADSSPATPQAAPDEPDPYADLADNISKALLRPIQGIEDRRADSLKSLEARLAEALQRLDGLGEKAGSADRRSEETARRIDGIEGGLRHDADELSASIVQLRGTLEKLSGDVEQLGERVSTQSDTVDGLRRLEGRRRDSLQRIAGAASEFQTAIDQLSQDSAEGVWTTEPAVPNE